MWSKVVTVNRATAVSASVLLVVVAGILVWRQLRAEFHNTATQMAELRNAVLVIDSSPTPMLEPYKNAESAGVATQQESSRDSGSRAKRFMLDRYYPDLQKETGFTSDDFNKLVELAFNPNEAEIEKGLGVAKYQRWKEYEAKVQSEIAVSRLRRNLASADALREDQADMLHRTIHAEKRRRDEELRMRAYARPTDPRLELEFEFGDLELKEESDRRLIYSVKSFLTEQQYAVLPEAIIDPNLASTRENLERIRARVNGRNDNTLHGVVAE